MKWIDLVKIVSKRNKGKPLSYSLKEASKEWKKMKGKKGKSGRHRGGEGEEVVPSEPNNESVPDQEPPQAGGRSRKSRKNKSSKRKGTRRR